jgi:hypothetical protein
MVLKDIMIFHNLKGMPFYDIAQNLMAISAYSMKTPHHQQVHSNFVRPWLITKACIRGGSRQPRLSQISLCLWEGFGLQTTSFEVFRSQTRVIVFFKN